MKPPKAGCRLLLERLLDLLFEVHGKLLHRHLGRLALGLHATRTERFQPLDDRVDSSGELQGYPLIRAPTRIGDQVTKIRVGLAAIREDRRRLLLDDSSHDPGRLLEGLEALRVHWAPLQWKVERAPQAGLRHLINYYHRPSSGIQHCRFDGCHLLPTSSLFNIAGIASTIRWMPHLRSP